MRTMWHPIFKVFRLCNDRGKFRISHSHSATPDVIATQVCLPVVYTVSRVTNKTTQPKLLSVGVVFSSLWAVCPFRPCSLVLTDVIYCGKYRQFSYSNEPVRNFRDNFSGRVSDSWMTSVQTL